MQTPSQQCWYKIVVLCRQSITHVILKDLTRPALHAKTPAFIHPVSFKMKRLSLLKPLKTAKALCKS